MSTRCSGSTHIKLSNLLFHIKMKETKNTFADYIVNPNDRFLEEIHYLLVWSFKINSVISCVSFIFCAF